MSKQPLPQMPRWDGPLSHPFYSHVVKRIIDFLFALILLIPGCIIMLPLAIWVKLDSPGPVLYKAVRGGYHNQPFYIYKFRSMVVGADKTGGCTALNDSRVTRAGKVMRRLKLDELAFGLLANNLRFVVPNRNESNKSRWKTCRFWERFLGAVEVLKLQVPKLHNSLEETQQWLTEGGVISAVKSFYFLEEHDALGGLEKVGTMLDKARYSNSLSSKLTAHLQRIDRTDLIPYIQYDTKHGKGGI